MPLNLAAISVLLFLGVLLPVMALAQSVQMRLFDKSGVEVGPMADGRVYVRIDAETIVGVPLAGKLIELPDGRLWRDNTRLVFWTGPNAVYFSEPNCTGIAYVQYSGNYWPDFGAQPSGTVANGPGRATTYIGQPGYAVHRKLASRLDQDFNCTTDLKLRASVVPVRTIVDLAEMFEPPFTMR